MRPAFRATYDLDEPFDFTDLIDREPAHDCFHPVNTRSSRRRHRYLACVRMADLTPVEVAHLLELASSCADDLFDLADRRRRARTHEQASRASESIHGLGELYQLAVNVAELMEADFHFFEDEGRNPHPARLRGLSGHDLTVFLRLAVKHPTARQLHREIARIAQNDE